MGMGRCCALQVNSQVLSGRGRALAKFLRHWLAELLSVDGFAGQSQAVTKKGLLPAHPGTAVWGWHCPPAIPLQLMALGAWPWQGCAVTVIDAPG